MKITKTWLALRAGAITLLAVSARADLIIPLIVEGDSLPHGAVTSISKIDVNNSGAWLAEIDTDAANWQDNTVVKNGLVIHQENTVLGIPASHSGSWKCGSFVDFIDINDNGDTLVMMRADDIAGLVGSTFLLIWTSGSTGVSHVLMETGVTPANIAGQPAGAVWSLITEVWQNNNDQLVVAGRSSSSSADLLAVVDHDGVGNLTAQTLFAIEGVVHSAAFPGATGTHADTVEGLSVIRQALAFNDAGQKMFYIDDQSFGSGGSPNYSGVDSHYYIDDQEIAWEASDAPSQGSFLYSQFTFAEVDLNNDGDWVAVWEDHNPDTSVDMFLAVNGVVRYQEGSAPPGIPGFVITGSNWGQPQISELGDITWQCTWNDPDTSKDRGLFQNDILLVQEGVTMIGNSLVESIATTWEVMAVSDNGRFIAQELVLAGGIEGAFLVDVRNAEYFCQADVGGVSCPCGNSSVGGAGCANSTGSGAVLEVNGYTSIGSSTMELSTSDSPSTTFGVFFQGTAIPAGGTAFLGDGVRCVGGAITRLQIIQTDQAGSAATSIDVVQAGAVSAGDTRYYQWWYRDTAGPCGGLMNLSNAAAVVWAP